MRWVEGFLSHFQTTVAEYEVTQQTDPDFVLFRLQCWKFIAWAETMRAAWKAACASGLLFATAKNTMSFFDVSTPLLKTVQEVSAIMEDVYNLKKKHGSFENQGNVTRNSIKKVFNKEIILYPLTNYSNR